MQAFLHQASQQHTSLHLHCHKIEAHLSIKSHCVAKSQEGVINDLVLLSAVGVRPVLVHGGGPEINIWLNKLGIEAQFKDGLRVTDGRHNASPSQLATNYISFF